MDQNDQALDVIRSIPSSPKSLRLVRTGPTDLPIPNPELASKDVDGKMSYIRRSSQVYGNPIEINMTNAAYVNQAFVQEETVCFT